MSVAKEGYPYIAILGLAGIIALVAGWRWPGGALLVLAAFVTFFFRDPDRKFEGTDQQIASPADGKVVWVRQEK